MIKKFAKSISGFCSRIRFKRLKRYEQFGITFTITYLITILFTILITLSYYEALIIEQGEVDSIWEYINSNHRDLTFGYCTTLDAWTYLSAKVFETLIPTTLTFSGTILIMQTTKEKTSSLNAWLFIFLFAFVMVGMLFMVAKLESSLKLFMWWLLFLFCLIFVFSARLFNIQNENGDLHKNEESDGKITG